AFQIRQRTLEFLRVGHHRAELVADERLPLSPQRSWRKMAGPLDMLGPDEIDGVVPHGAEAASPSAATARRGGTATTEPDRSDRGQRGADPRPTRLCTPAPPTASV